MEAGDVFFFPLSLIQEALTSNLGVLQILLTKLQNSLRGITESRVTEKKRPGPGWVLNPRFQCSVCQRPRAHRHLNKETY